MNLSSLVLSAQYYLSSAGQLDISILWFLLHSLHCLRYLLCLSWLKANLSLDYSLPLLSLWITYLCPLEFPTSVSSPLCNVSQRGGHLSPYELSTSSSSNGSLFRLCREMIHPPAQQSNRTSNFICLSLFFHQI